jgi:hypothetical protein
MEIPDNEMKDILGIEASNSEVKGNGNLKRKQKRRVAQPTVPQPSGLPTSSSSHGNLSTGNLVDGAFATEATPEATLAELLETKQRLAKVTEVMEGMQNEIETLRMANPRPIKIFALGFIPSVVLAKSHVDMLKWVSDVLASNMKIRMDCHRDHFSIMETVTGIEAVGVRTCPIYNRMEFCALKWHHMTKMARSGRTRAELRIHCCTLCLEALGIICGHPLLKCPWIYEETWKNIPRRESQDK